MPDDKVVIGGGIDNLLCLCHACGDAIPLFPCRLREPLRRVVKHLELPVLLFGDIRRPSQFVIPHLEFGQVVARIVITEVRRLLNEEGPCGKPQPKLFFLVRVERQVVRLRAVTLEKPRECLPRVHDLKIARIVDELLVLVRRRCRRRYELVRNASELREECLIGLTPERAQDRRLVKARARECIGANIPVTDALIVRDKKPSGRSLYFLHVADVDGCVHVEKRHRVAHKLLFDTQRAHDEYFPALVFVDETAPFELHDRLAKSERREDRTPSARRRPHDRIPLMRLECGTDFPRVYGDACLFGNDHFRLQEVAVFLHVVPLVILPHRPP